MVFESSIYSLFVTNPGTTEEIFGGVSELPYNLSLGLRNLQDLVDRASKDLATDAGQTDHVNVVH